MSSRPSNSTPCPRSLAVTTSLIFLILICGLPLVQLVGEVAGSPHTIPVAFRCLPNLVQALQDHGETESVAARVIAINHRVCQVLRDYETLVTESAWPVRPPRAWLQALLTGPLRSGNEQVIVGSDRGLYFRPDIEALTGPPFLQPPVLRPGLAVAQRQSNPLPAIQQFAADLQLRGIDLWLLPVPSKAARLAAPNSNRNAALPVHNISYPQFLTELTRSGITVCDLSQPLLPTGLAPHYLQMDSHWTPAGMQRAVQVLAGRMKSQGLFQEHSPTRFRTSQRNVQNIGDTARLLSPGTASPLMPPEYCQITQVLTSQGATWTPDPDAPILLLGDSFTNIYSQPELGWGTSAGLAEQLSLALGFRIDRLALNAGGAQATRRELVRQLRQGTDRLAGKRLVIWQFAERELSQGDWQIIPLPEPSSKPQTAVPANITPPRIPGSVLVEAVIAQAGRLPNPATLPYREALIPLHLQHVQTTGTASIPNEIVVYVWGLRDRKLTPQAGLQTGQRVRLELTPWSQAEREFGRLARAELDDPDFRLIDLPTYWATPVP